MNVSFLLRHFEKAIGRSLSQDEWNDAGARLGFEMHAQEVGMMDPNVVVARVVDVKPHPNADRLRICEVFFGDPREHLQVVCGCPSVRAGMYVPLAKVGAIIHGKPLSSSILRDVASHGMLCSAKDLGLEGLGQDGLWELPNTFPPGTPLHQVLPIYDHLLTFEVAAHRTDCLSLAGLAREWRSVIDHLPSTSHGWTPKLDSESWEGFWIECRVPEDFTLPPAFKLDLLFHQALHELEAVNLQRWLELQVGMPLHVYGQRDARGWNLAQLTQEHTWEGLNEQSYALLPGDWVVMKGDTVMSLPGLLGGKEGQVEKGQRTFCLEILQSPSAWVRALQQRLKIRTNAGLKSTRGFPQGMAREAHQSILNLLRSLPQLEIVQVQEHSQDGQPRRIAFRAEALERLLGIRFSEAQIDQALRTLGCTWQDHHVIPPWYRSDLVRACDIVEEVLRFWGYQNIQGTEEKLLPMAPRNDTLQSIHALCTGLGMDQTIGYAFYSPKDDASLGLSEPAIVLSNPIQQEYSIMRRSLFPGLWKTAQHRLAQRAPGVKLYEMGRIYHQQAEGFIESDRLAWLWTGYPSLWSAAQNRGLIQAEDVVEAIHLYAMHMGHRIALRRSASPAAFLHPNMAAEIFVGERIIGYWGEVHPSYTMDGHPAFYVEWDFSNLDKEKINFKEFSRHPYMHRDWSFWCDLTLSYREIEDFLSAIKAPWLVSWEFLDRYVPENTVQRQSFALRLFIDVQTFGLKSEDIDACLGNIQEEMKKVLSVEFRNNENTHSCQPGRETL